MSTTPQKILVTGATGFTGSYTVPALLDAGYEVVCFVRSSSDRQFLPADRISFFEGDLDNQASLTAALAGCDAIVNIASLGFGHADGIVQAIEAAGITRAIFVSTTALFTKLNAPSKAVRIVAESRIEHSSLNYTILRPTMIYGSGRDRNICRLIRYLSRIPILPVFGTGTYLLQPIHVTDVAQAIVKALPEKATHRQAYNISGQTELTYNQLVETVSNALGRKTWKLHIPHKPVIVLLNLIEKWVTLPIKAEQIQRLNEHKNFSFNSAKQDFDFLPKSFANGVHLELEDMDLS